MKDIKEFVEKFVDRESTFIDGLLLRSLERYATPIEIGDRYIKWKLYGGQEIKTTSKGRLIQ